MGSDQLSYEITGSGQSVVLLHGFLENSKMWNVLVPDLEKFQLIRIDFIGHGSSKARDVPVYSMEFLAELVQDILEENKVQSPIIIGHSMGGYVGLELIKTIPFKKLILLNSNFWEDSDERISNRNRLIEVVQKNKGLFINEAIRNLFYIQNESITTRISRLQQEAMQMKSEDIIKTSKGLRDRRNHTKTVEQFYTKIFILQATEDPIISWKEMEAQLSQLTKKPELHLIENSGHMSIWENFKATKSILTKLLS